MKTSRWIVLLAALFACAVLGAALVKNAGGGRVARIYQDDRLVREISLDDVESEYEIMIECATGYNVVALRPGGIRVAAADCHDNTCVKQGWLEGGLTPIVCLPHGLVIRVETPVTAPEPEIDAVAG